MKKRVERGTQKQNDPTAKHPFERILEKKPLEEQPLAIKNTEETTGEKINKLLEIAKGDGEAEERIAAVNELGRLVVELGADGIHVLDELESLYYAEVEKSVKGKKAAGLVGALENAIAEACEDDGIWQSWWLKK